MLETVWLKTHFVDVIGLQTASTAAVILRLFHCINIVTASTRTNYYQKNVCFSTVVIVLLGTIFCLYFYADIIYYFYHRKVYVHLITVSDLMSYLTYNDNQGRKLPIKSNLEPAITNLRQIE